jgi:hypothetical protein
MRVVESLPADGHVARVQADREAGLSGRRRAAERHEEPVGDVAQLEVGVVYPPSLPQGTSPEASRATRAALDASGDDPDQ